MSARGRALTLLMAVLGLGPVTSWASTPEEMKAQAQQEDPQAVILRERWGIESPTVWLTASGHMLDFRYRIVDPDKALPLLSQKNPASLVDQASGVTLRVPHAAKIGTLRQYSLAPKPGRTFVVLFANAGNVVQRGSKVTVKIGDVAIEGLVVQ